jgi:hypothetical protein
MLCLFIRMFAANKKRKLAKMGLESLSGSVGSSWCYLVDDAGKVVL